MASARDLRSEETILKLENVHMYFGRVAALAGVSLEVKKGEIHSIIGPNGAGKTVMMNCINGLYKPQRGRITYKGQDITARRPHERASLGISRTFQKIELFGGMTVLDNIRLGRHIHLKSGIVSGSIYVGKTKREELESRKFIEEEIIDLLEGPRDPERCAFMRSSAGDVFALIGDPASLGFIETVDAVHHDGLAGSVGSDDGVDFSLLHFQVHACERCNSAKVHVNILELEYSLVATQVFGVSHSEASVYDQHCFK